MVHAPDTFQVLGGRERKIGRNCWGKYFKYQYKLYYFHSNILGGTGWGHHDEGEGMGAMDGDAVAAADWMEIRVFLWK